MAAVGRNFVTGTNPQRDRSIFTKGPPDAPDHATKKQGWLLHYSPGESAPLAKPLKQP